jgi:hypothetical protein
MSEAELTRATRKLLDYLGAWQMKVHGHLGQRPGVPDIIACIQGRFVAIELKGARGRVTPQQEQEIRRIRAAGGIAGVARSLEDVVTLLQEVLPGLSLLPTEQGEGEQ